VTGLLKKLAFWSYGRSTWQYDVLCALILAFIFLTPKAWFAGEPAPPLGHQIPTATATRTLLLAWPDERTAAPPDTAELERRARLATGRQNARVVGGPAPVRDETGTVVAYRVDIE
jgi:hypothetical protein